MAKNIQNDASTSDNNNSKNGNKIRLIFSSPTLPGPVSSITVNCDKLLDINGLILSGVVRIHEDGSEVYYDPECNVVCSHFADKIEEILRAAIVNNDQRKAVFGLIQKAMNSTIRDFEDSVEWCNKTLKKEGVTQCGNGLCTCEVID